MKNAITIIILSLILIACGEVTIDGSSEAAMKASIAEVKEGLEPVDRVKLEEAIKAIAFSDITSFKGMMVIGLNPELAAQKIMSKLDGLTYDQVLLQAKDVTEQQRQKKLNGTKAELKEAESQLAGLKHKQQEKIDNAKIIKSKFLVTDVKYNLTENPVMDLVEISMDIENKLNIPVSMVYANARLITPGRSIPWIKDKLMILVEGGIEPGEKRNISTMPTRVLAWSRFKKEAKTAVVEMSVYRVNGADNKTNILGEVFEYDISAISKLEERIAKLKAIIGNS